MHTLFLLVPQKQDGGKPSQASLVSLSLLIPRGLTHPAVFSLQATFSSLLYIYLFYFIFVGFKDLVTVSEKSFNYTKYLCTVSVCVLGICECELNYFNLKFT